MCPKCGASSQASNPYEAFMGSGRGLSIKGASKRYCRGGSGCQVSPPVDTGKEHLDRECGDCGYTWSQPCEDAKP